MKKTILAVGSALLALAVLEAGLRLYDLARGRSVRARTSWYWMFEQDPCLGFRGRPDVSMRTDEDLVRHDHEGFRDDRSFEQISGTRGRRLVVCVGESSTYGICAGTNSNTYPAALERHLRTLTGDGGWIVLNAGQPGYTSREIVQLVQLRLMKLRPEVVLAMNLRNDLEFVSRSLDDGEDYNFYPLRVAQISKSWPNELLMRSSLYGLIVSRLRPKFVDDLGGIPPTSLHQTLTERGVRFYLDNLAQLGVVCSRGGATLMLVDQPVIERPPSYDDQKRQSLRELRQHLRAFCLENRITLLAANDRIDWSGLAVCDDVHLGLAGYDRLAAILAPQILEHRVHDGP